MEITFKFPDGYVLRMPLREAIEFLRQLREGGWVLADEEENNNE